MEGKTASLIGATGLIGSNLLDQLIKDDHYKNIKVITRRDIPVNIPNVDVSVIDFSDYTVYKNSLKGSDAVFCAVGTTQKKVKGDEKEYRKVDYDIPVNGARICAETGISHFLLVSSVGADSKSKNFYIRLKGEAEDAILKLKIPSVNVFRPSLLLGKRNEFRFGEKIAQVFMSLFSFLIPSKYKPIKASDVASAMINASKVNYLGHKIYHYKDMMKLISK